MKDFSIKQLERFSGVKAHTIRIWEQRYGILEPRRAKGNIRHYTLADVELLLNIVLLLRNGAKISDLAGISSPTISQKTSALTADHIRRTKSLNQLIICMYSGDIERFEDTLDSCVLSWDVDKTLDEIIIPFLEKVELLSYRDSSCETHLAVTAIRRKIILGLERVNPVGSQDKCALLFLSEGEHYDLMLLYLSYIFKKNGIKVLYLGTNISNHNVKTIANVKQPNYLVTYVPQKKKFTMESLIPFLNEHLPESTLVVVGCENNLRIQMNSGIVKVMHFKEIDTYVKYPDRHRVSGT